MASKMLYQTPEDVMESAKQATTMGIPYIKLEKRIVNPAIPQSCTYCELTAWNHKLKAYAKLIVGCFNKPLYASIYKLEKQFGRIPKFTFLLNDANNADRFTDAILMIDKCIQDAVSTQINIKEPTHTPIQYTRADGTAEDVRVSLEFPIVRVRIPWQSDYKAGQPKDEVYDPKSTPSCNIVNESKCTVVDKKIQPTKFTPNELSYANICKTIPINSNITCYFTYPALYKSRKYANTAYTSPISACNIMVNPVSPDVEVDLSLFGSDILAQKMESISVAQAAREECAAVSVVTDADDIDDAQLDNISF